MIKKRRKQLKLPPPLFNDETNTITSSTTTSTASNTIIATPTITPPNITTTTSKFVNTSDPSTSTSTTITTTITRKPFSLPKATRVSLQPFGHFSFRHRLISKAQADPTCNKQVVITTEEYTTKQCPICGNVHHKIGGNEKYVCSKCGFLGDRDCVGSFNVRLRSLTKGEVKGI